MRQAPGWPTDLGLRQGFRRREAHVAVFVVVHVALQGAAEGRGGRGEGVDGAEAAVPEVRGGVF